MLSVYWDPTYIYNCHLCGSCFMYMAFAFLIWITLVMKAFKALCRAYVQPYKPCHLGEYAASVGLKACHLTFRHSPPYFLFLLVVAAIIPRSSYFYHYFLNYQLLYHFFSPAEIRTLYFKHTFSLLIK